MHHYYKRPVGLTVLAVVNFLQFAIASFAIVVILRRLTAIENYYPLLISIAIAILYLTTGIGFLKMHRWFGYFLGNIFGVGLIVTFGRHIFQGQFADAAPYLVYPTIMLLLLNFKYRYYFQPNVAALERQKAISSGIIFCIQCGARNSVDRNFCEKCENQLLREDAQISTQQRSAQ